MEATDRFLALVQSERDDLPLDLGALLIAAHANPGLDVAASRARLDELAAACASPTFDAIREHLFVVEGFRGNVDHYGDPANSLLDAVLQRRVGIPISLAVVTMEVARRLDVDVRGVGMPGHFLVQEGSGRGRYCDPFDAGRLLDVGGCRAVHDRVFGGTRPFNPGDLIPISSRAILARMLSNLERGPLGRVPEHARWMLMLHLAIPGTPAVERAAMAARLTALRARLN